MPIWLGSSKIGKIWLGSSKIGKIYLGSSLVYQARSADITLSVSGQPTYFNSGIGQSYTFGDGYTATATVPAGYTKLVVTAFTPSQVFGYWRDDLLLNNTVKIDTGIKSDQQTPTSWVNRSFNITSGRTITFRIKGARDINRDGQTTNISGSVTFHYE